MKSLLVSSFFLLVLLSVPTGAYAANATFFGPIVPPECHCDNQAGPDGKPITTAPDYGCILQTIQNSINFAVSFSIILFIIYLTIAGFMLVISGGSSEARSQGKTRLLNVIIGLAVLLCSWLIIDFVMKTLYDEGKFGPWNAILADNSNEGGGSFCIVSKNPESITTGTLDILYGSGSTSGSASGGGGSCTALADSQLVAIDSSGHKLIPESATRFKAMKAAAAKDGITLTVSSAYRSPEDQLRAWNENGCRLVNGSAVCNVRTAAVPCSLGGTGSNHTRGTAVDITLNNGVYAWLRSNAGQYGFYNNLPNDLPHWSDTGR